MVKPALAATRSVRVLDFLALHPGQAFSLKEISNACAVNAASLLAVITALVDGGYLLRHPSHKTYTIGPGVVALGHAALVQHPSIEAARHELGVLEGDLKAHCSASVLMGTTLVAVAMAGRPRQATTATQTGTRLPFVAPFGAAFAAFGSEKLRQTWSSMRYSAVASLSSRSARLALSWLRCFNNSPKSLATTKAELESMRCWSTSPTHWLTWASVGVSESRWHPSTHRSSHP